MKKLITFFFLFILLIGCKKNTEPSQPDAATIVAGNYKLIKATIDGKDVTDTYESTLTISRITANSVESITTFPSGTSPVKEIWALKMVNNDLIEIKGVGTHVHIYQNGQIPFTIGGVLQMVFEKKR